MRTSNTFLAEDWYGVDFRVHPEMYCVGRGEQGVLTAEPYKSEILPFWRFKTPEIAKKSSDDVYKLFLKYALEDDSIGMDMARKFLQMGYTRSRRYANHKSGKKYIGPVPADMKGRSGAHGRPIAPFEVDKEKALCATFFKEKLDIVNQNQTYLEAKKKLRK